MSLVTDLRSITRNADSCLTLVSLVHPSSENQLWLMFGEAHIRECKPKHELCAYLHEGATDMEHDSAWALRVPLIGLTYQSVAYHTLTCQAWVAPWEDAPFREDMRVPLPGQDYWSLAFERQCREKTCCVDDDGNFDKKHPGHPITKYLPDPANKLHRLLGGRLVEIQMGPLSAFDLAALEKRIKRNESSDPQKKPQRVAREGQTLGG